MVEEGEIIEKGEATVIRKIERGWAYLSIPSKRFLKKIVPNAKIKKTGEYDSYIAEIPNKVRIIAEFVLKDVGVLVRNANTPEGEYVIRSDAGGIGRKLAEKIVKSCKFEANNILKCEIELDGADILAIRDFGILHVGEKDDDLNWI